MTWTDDFGGIVSVGNTIEFMTLYGRRQAKVLEIIKDKRKPILRDGEGQKNVIFVIAPIQVGPVGTFKPIERVATDSMYNPRKAVGEVEFLV